MNTLSLGQVRQVADSVLQDRPPTVPAWAWDLPGVPPQLPRTYYAFLHALVRACEPEFIVELGTDQGTSAMFLATATLSPVLSIDCDSRTTEHPQEMAVARGLVNVSAFTSDTVRPAALERVASYGRPIDLLFIDTDHCLAHIRKETAAYFPLMRPGGLVAYDDIHINGEMSQFWAELDKPKIEVLQPYWAGFGVSIA